MWVELVLALIVEGYHEFVEWWQKRSWWRPREAPDDGFTERPLEAGSLLAVAQATRSSPVVGHVDAILDRHASKHVAVGVGVYREGEVWTLGRGRVGGDRPKPPSPDTIFEIGSITKVFTATVLADLVEEGLVALGDPVQRYLPEGVLLPVRGQPITLADLATHTSGLPRFPKGLIRQSLRHRDNPYARFTAAHLEHALTEAKLKGEPGDNPEPRAGGPAASRRLPPGAMAQRRHGRLPQRRRLRRRI